MKTISLISDSGVFKVLTYFLKLEKLPIAYKLFK